MVFCFLSCGCYCVVLMLCVWVELAFVLGFLWLFVGVIGVVVYWQTCVWVCYLVFGLISLLVCCVFWILCFGFGLFLGLFDWFVLFELSLLFVADGGLCFRSVFAFELFLVGLGICVLCFV